MPSDNKHHKNSIKYRIKEEKVNEKHFIAKGINVSCCTMEGTAYVLFEDKEEVIALNETGSIVWGLIDGNSTISEVTAKVLELFDGDHAKIKTSVAMFLEELLSLGAITLSAEKFEGVMQSV